MGPPAHAAEEQGTGTELKKRASLVATVCPLGWGLALCVHKNEVNNDSGSWANLEVEVSGATRAEWDGAMDGRGAVGHPRHGRCHVLLGGRHVARVTPLGAQGLGQRFGGRAAGALQHRGAPEAAQFGRGRGLER